MEAEMTYDIGDRLWTCGCNIATRKWEPVEVTVDNRALEQTHKNGCWREYYGCLQWEHEDCCLAYQPDPTREDESGHPLMIPTHYKRIPLGDLFESKEALLKTFDNDQLPF